MGWSSFWHAVSHPIDTIKSAGASVAHAAESAFHKGVEFVKHTASKAAIFVGGLPPVQFIAHNSDKIIHAAQDVGHALASGAKTAFEFVKHTRKAIGGGVKDVWDGAKTLLDMTKIISYTLTGGSVLIAMNMMKWDSSCSLPPAKRRAF